MKRNYYSLFAAATMLFAATSCSQEESFAPEPISELTTFKVSLEGATKSRAAGDGMTATKLYFEVYQGDRKVVDNFGEGSTSHYSEPVAIVDGQAEISLPLLRGELYDIMFWAQAADGSIYDPTDLKAIKVNYQDANGANQTKANIEKYDAFFYGHSDFQATNNVTEIKLRRPFAQLNIGTTKEDWQTAISMIDDTNLPVTTSEVTVTGLANQFDVLAGEASGEVDVTFTKNELLPVKDDQGQTVDVENFFATVQDVENEYRYLAMNYLLVPGEATSLSEDKVSSTTSVDVTFWRGNQLLFKIEKTNLANLPIQRNWRTNILGNLLSADKTFEIVVDPIFNNEDHNITMDVASTSEELEEMLKQDLEHIVIDLATVEGRAAKEYTIAIGANKEEYYIGSANTKTITINARGNTINFVHENTDWNYIRCVNDDAKWIINDAHLTNSGANDGPWNRHDIRFYNAVELNNVTSDKAIALLNDGKLNKVTISDARAKDDYGLWITAEGQTVELDGCTFNMIKEGDNTGRGIAIKDQYVDEADRKKVTLKVSNTTFNTEAKAAILVTSTAGADIALENIDITGVQADNVCAVWVDSERADSFDLVTVKGGMKALEDAGFYVDEQGNYYATSTNAISDFIENGMTEINLGKGTFEIPSTIAGKTITFNGMGDDTKFDFTKAYNVNEATITFKNLYIEGKNANVMNGYGIQHTTKTIKYENCTLNNAITNENGGNVEYNGCNFTGTYYIATYSVKSATFTNCTFDREDSRAVLVYSHGNNPCVVTLSDCTFKAKAKGYTGVPAWTAAVEVDTSNITSEGTTVTITNCTADANYNGIVRDKSAAGKANAVINVDGWTYDSAGFWIDAEGNYKAYNSDGLQAALDKTDNLTIYLGAGDFGTIVAKSNKTIIGSENAKVDAVNLNGAEKLTLKNIKFDAATAVLGCDGKGKGKQYANIVTGIDGNNPIKGAMNLVIDGCTFEGTFANGGAAICFADQNRKSGGSGNVTIKNCTFNTASSYYDIYGHYTGNGSNGYGDFVIENNTFKSELTQLPVYLGRYASSTPVVVMGNVFETKTSLEAAVYVQDHSSYGVSVDASDNTFAN